MTVTGRLSGKKLSAKSKALASSAGDIVRESRVEELRRMVASGHYKVDAYKLALKIMVRAMARTE